MLVATTKSDALPIARRGATPPAIWQARDRDLLGQLVEHDLAQKADPAPVPHGQMLVGVPRRADMPVGIGNDPDTSQALREITANEPRDARHDDRLLGLCHANQML